MALKPWSSEAERKAHFEELEDDVPDPPPAPATA